MLSLRRVDVSDVAIIGTLALGDHRWLTLEDGPTQGKGAIPVGVYPIVLSYSERFRALLPELLNVPGRTGIRIHAGNTEADTEGCILLGLVQVDAHTIGRSRDAMAQFLRRWSEWHGTTIEVT